jgi:DNA-binding IclR family transcriptional regulator
MAGNSADTGRSVTSKVVSILLTFTDGNVQSLTEIARLAGLPVSTAHRLVTELAAWGVLERTDDAHYRPGVPLRVIGGQTVHPAGLHERARRVMEDVVTATRANVRLAVLEGLEVAYTEKLVGHRPVSIFAGEATLPAHATAMGKALLAFSPPSVVDALLERGLERFTPYTLTTPDRLRRALAVIRLTRVALCRWELELGSAAVAVPVFGGGGTVVAALELKVRDLRSDLHTLQPALVVAARCLSRELATGQPFGQFAGATERRPGATGFIPDGYGTGRVYGPVAAGARSAPTVGYLNGTGGSGLRTVPRRLDTVSRKSGSD